MQSKAPNAAEVPLHGLLAEVLAGDPTDGGFEVQYQPIVRFAGVATVAVEAIACWRPPVTGAGVDATRTEAMCQAVLDVCERIGLTVIAQGISATEQAAALRAMGCRIGQGELYGPALRLQRMGRAGKSKVAR